MILSEETNRKIGRISNEKTLSFGALAQLVERLRAVNPEVKIKFNTVVNRYNYDELLLPRLRTLLPDKIKVFRQLPFRNEKGIRSEQFNLFLEVNGAFEEGTWIEDNDEMVHSYLMIDPMGRLFENGNPEKYRYSEPIYSVGMECAFKQIAFDVGKFRQRYQPQHSQA